LIKLDMQFCVSSFYLSRKSGRIEQFSKIIMPLFALSIFLSAFLLFQIQPMIGRFIPPWFGGMVNSDAVLSSPAHGLGNGDYGRGRSGV
jgi:hypothetical protein